MKLTFVLILTIGLFVITQAHPPSFDRLNTKMEKESELLKSLPNIEKNTKNMLWVMWKILDHFEEFLKPAESHKQKTENSESSDVSGSSSPMELTSYSSRC